MEAEIDHCTRTIQTPGTKWQPSSYELGDFKYRLALEWCLVNPSEPAIHVELAECYAIHW
jgi:hypothetical protein